MQATRRQILDFLRERGEANVRSLGEHLELTATGVRQHLTILEREGLIASREVRGRVGRPALSYRLTDEGEALYPKAYDRLALAMIAAAHRRLPRREFTGLLRDAAAVLAEPHVDEVGRGTPSERMEALCGVLRTQQIVVDYQHAAGGFVLEQRTCPFHDAVEDSTATCDLDAAVLGALTHLDVDLLTSRARGDATCTFMIHTAAAPDADPDVPVRGAGPRQ